jgi:predicted GTPase
MERRRVLILGAAGRDFHNFNVRYRDDASVEVVAFTAAQIPDIDGRTYPPGLAGAHYPRGVPIRPEDDLEAIVRDEDVDEVVFSYSDISHEDVMHLAARAVAAGASFTLLGARATMLDSRRPVISIGAVRTGCGKSQTTRAVCRILRAAGRKVVAIRHPMPYGDLHAQAVQRFATLEDLDEHRCTIEEREEYEPHIAAGTTVFAGVDYQAILSRAEEEADVIVWDGGNNDLPFFRANLEIVVTDPHRAGHELTFWPGEANLRRADVVIINKVGTAPEGAVETVRGNVRDANPSARVIEAESPVIVDDPGAIVGKRVLVIEDGPTLTHGHMKYGAGVVAALQAGAEIVDPRPWAVGSIAGIFEQYPDIGSLLPAMGYSDQQVADLGETIRRAEVDAYVIGTPIDLRRLVEFPRTAVRVTYELRPVAGPSLEELVLAAAQDEAP